MRRISSFALFALIAIPVFADTPADPIAICSSETSSVSFVETELADVMAFIGESTGMTIEFSEAAAGRGKEPVTITVRELEVGSLLILTCKPLGLVPFIESGEVIIRTVEEHFADANRVEQIAAVSVERKKERIDALERKLAELRLDFKFDAVPLRDVLSFVQDFGGVNVVVDPEVDADKAVTMQLNQSSLETGLKLALAPLGADFELREGVIYIYVS